MMLFTSRWHWAILASFSVVALVTLFQYHSPIGENTPLSVSTDDVRFYFSVCFRSLSHCIQDVSWLTGSRQLCLTRETHVSQISLRRKKSRKLPNSIYLSLQMGHTFSCAERLYHQPFWATRSLFSTVGTNPGIWMPLSPILLKCAM